MNGPSHHRMPADTHRDLHPGKVTGVREVVPSAEQLAKRESCFERDTQRVTDILDANEARLARARELRAMKGVLRGIEDVLRLAEGADALQGRPLTASECREFRQGWEAEEARLAEGKDKERAAKNAQYFASLGKALEMRPGMDGQSVEALDSDDLLADWMESMQRLDTRVAEDKRRGYQTTVKAYEEGLVAHPEFQEVLDLIHECGTRRATLRAAVSQESLENERLLSAPEPEMESLHPLSEREPDVWHHFVLSRALESWKIPESAQECAKALLALDRAKQAYAEGVEVWYSQRFGDDYPALKKREERFKKTKEDVDAWREGNRLNYVHSWGATETSSFLEDEKGWIETRFRDSNADVVSSLQMAERKVDESLDHFANRIVQEPDTYAKFSKRGINGFIREDGEEDRSFQARVRAELGKRCVGNPNHLSPGFVMESVMESDENSRIAIEARRVARYDLKLKKSQFISGVYQQIDKEYAEIQREVTRLETTDVAERQEVLRSYRASVTKCEAAFAAAYQAGDHETRSFLYRLDSVGFQNRTTFGSISDLFEGVNTTTRMEGHIQEVGKQGVPYDKVRSLPVIPGVEARKHLESGTRLLRDWIKELNGLQKGGQRNVGFYAPETLKKIQGALLDQRESKDGYSYPVLETISCDTSQASSEAPLRTYRDVSPFQAKFSGCYEHALDTTVNDLVAERQVVRTELLTLLETFQDTEALVAGIRRRYPTRVTV